MDLSNIIKGMFSYSQNKNSKMVLNILNTRESIPVGYNKLIKIKNLSKIHKESYLSRIGRINKPKSDKITKYKLKEYTDDEIHELDNNGFAIIFHQYAGDIEILLDIFPSYVYDCSGCMYNIENYIIVISTWSYGDRYEYHNQDNCKEYDILYFNNMTGLLDQTKSLRYIHSTITKDDSEYMLKNKIALNLFKNGLCDLNCNNHNKQCPKKIGKQPLRTVDNPTETDEYI